jgi:tRNA pseudouridine55 synthase
VSPDGLEQRGAGLVVVDKPGGMTSHDVVSRVRRLAGTRKVGHAGTLDPMATGVLVVGLNRATRLLGHLQVTDKAYDATIRLGAATTSDDADGEVVATASTVGVSDDAVRDALEAMVGDIEQVPSAVSAIKVDGRRAYDLVRSGEQVELAPRPVRIHSIETRTIRRDDTGLEIDVSVRCSSGTYIRAIARDLGSVLRVGGHLTALRRTAVGAFDLGQASTLEELADDLRVVPIEEAARAAFAAVDLSEEHAADVTFGRRIELALPGVGPHAVFAPDGEFLALYEQDGAVARAVAVFV